MGPVGPTNRCGVVDRSNAGPRDGGCHSNAGARGLSARFLQAERGHLPAPDSVIVSATGPVGPWRLAAFTIAHSTFDARWPNCELSVTQGGNDGRCAPRHTSQFIVRKPAIRRHPCVI